jgi:hypothetical protein
VSSALPRFLSPPNYTTRIFGSIDTKKNYYIPENEVVPALKSFKNWMTMEAGSQELELLVERLKAAGFWRDGEQLLVQAFPS